MKGGNEMTYYADEVPKELKLNEIYTSRELYLYLMDNPKNTIILGENSLLTDSTEIKYKIVDIKEKFLHSKSKNSYKTYLIPSTKSIIVEIENA
jgi:hypothetical protein